MGVWGQNVPQQMPLGYQYIFSGLKEIVMLPHKIIGQ